MALQSLTQAQAGLCAKLSLVRTPTLDRAARGKIATSYVFSPQMQLPPISHKAAKGRRDPSPRGY